MPPLTNLDGPQAEYDRDGLPPQCRDVRTGVEMGRGDLSYGDIDHTMRWYSASPATAGWWAGVNVSEFADAAVA